MPTPAAIVPITAHPKYPKYAQVRQRRRTQPGKSPSSTNQHVQRIKDCLAREATRRQRQAQDDKRIADHLQAIKDQEPKRWLTICKKEFRWSQSTAYERLNPQHVAQRRERNAEAARKSRKSNSVGNPTPAEPPSKPGLRLVQSKEKDDREQRADRAKRRKLGRILVLAGYQRIRETPYRDQERLRAVRDRLLHAAGTLA